MGEEEIVGAGFIAPTYSCDRCGVFGNRCTRCAAQRGAVRNSEQLIPRNPEDRAEWGGYCLSGRLS